MNVIRIFLFGHVILLWSNKIDCSSDTIYKLKFVRDIIEPSSHRGTSFTIGKHPVVDTDQLEEEERIEMCTEALKFLEETEGRHVGIKFIQYGNTELSKQYAIDPFVEPNKPKPQPEIVQVFECPTEPPIYIEVLSHSDGQIANVIVKKSDLQQMSTAIDNMIYEVKFVREVFEPTSQQRKSYDGKKDIVLDTNKLTEEQRLKMCKQILRINSLAFRNIRFLENSSIGPKKLFGIELEEGPYIDTHIVEAFRCPTSPPTFLHVHAWWYGSYYVWVIINEDELSPRPIITSPRPRKPQTSIPNISTIPTDSTEQRPVSTSTKYRESTEARPTVTQSTTFTSTSSSGRRYRERIEVTPISVGRHRTSTEAGAPRRSREFIDPTYNSSRRSTESVDSTTHTPTSGRVREYREPSPVTPTSLTDPAESRPFPSRQSRETIEPRERIEMDRQGTVRGAPSAFEIEEEEEDDSAYQFQLKIVEDISHSSIGSYTEAKSLYSLIRPSIDIDTFSEHLRRKFCKKALRLVQTEKSNVKFVTNEVTEPSEYYVLHPSSGQPELIKAFKCPTNPPIYLNLNKGQDGNIVWVIVKQSELFPTFDFINYELKVVKAIKEASTREIKSRLSSSIQNSIVDTDNFTEEQRRQICQKAMLVVSGRQVKYLHNVMTEFSKLYFIQTYVRKGKTNSELIQAFKCPTVPPIYLQVRDWEYEGFNVWVFIEDVISGPNLTEISYQVKLVENITEATSLEANMTDRSNQIDTDKLTEEKRLQICKQASEIEELAYRNIKFMESWTRTENEKVYKLDLIPQSGRRRIRQYEFVHAFRCPTNPSIYIQLEDSDFGGYMVWVIVKEAELPIYHMITKYEVKLVSNISEASPHEISLRPSSRRELSVVNTDAFTEDQRIDICKTALSMEPERNIRIFEDNLCGKSTYYVLDVQLPDDHITEHELVRAFRCPTKPAIYLELSGSKDEGYSVWIIIKQDASPPGLTSHTNISYNVKFVDEIVEASSHKVRTFSLTKKTAVNADKFSEEERLQMCRKASKLVQGGNIKFLDREPVGKNKNYALIFGIEVASSEPQFVQAFKCPTIPAIYLEVHQEDEGYIIWIIIDQGSREASTSFEDDITYHVKYITDIRQASSGESSEFQPTGGSRLVNTDAFTESQRIKICKKAMEMVPRMRITLLERSSTGRNTFYITNTGRLKAFECPTAPPIYLQVLKNEFQDYVVQIFILRGSKPISSTFDGVNYQLHIVASVVNINSHGAISYEITDVPPLDYVQYTKADYENMCKNALQIIPEHEFIGWLQTSKPDEEELYVVEDLESGKQELVPAFRCPTEPPIYLQTYVAANSERAIRVLIEDSEVPRPSAK